MKNGVAAFLLLLLVPVLAWGQASPALVLKSRIPLPKVDGRIDHLSADLKGRRLFVSALGNHTVEALDVAAGKVVRTLSGLGEPQGLLYDPLTNRLFVASSLDGTVKIFDGASFELLQTAKFSADADNVRYDARANRVIVGYGGEKFVAGRVARGQGDGALAFLDAGGKKLGQISVDAHPESFALETAGTRAFVNVPDRREIQVADLVKGAVLAHWPVTGASGNFPMALDEAHHRLFVGCRAPATLLVFDTETGKTVASLPIVGDTDDVFYDASKSRVYVIGGAGFVDVLQQADADRYVRAARFSIPAGSRTGLLVPEWGKLFVAVPHRGAQTAEIIVYAIK